MLDLMLRPVRLEAGLRAEVARRQEELDARRALQRRGGAAPRRLAHAIHGRGSRATISRKQM